MPYPTASGMPSLSGSYIPQLFCMRILVAFYAFTCLAAISNTDYENEIKKFGDKVIVRTLPEGVIDDYVKGQPLNYRTPEPGTVDFYVDKGKYFAISLNDLDKAQSDLEYVSKWAAHYAQLMKIAIEQPVLADIVGDVHAANMGQYAGAISGAFNLGYTGHPLEIKKANVLDAIVEANACLDEQNVPENDRWMVIPAWMAAKIKGSDLRNASITGDSVSILRNGRLGDIDRTTLYISNLLSRVTDSGSVVTNVLFGQKTALTFASQFTNTETLRNPNDFGDLLRSLQVYGYKVIKPEAIGRLYVKPGSDAA